MQTATPVSSSTPSTITSNDSWEDRLQQASVFLGISSKEIEEILVEYGVEKEPAGVEMLSDEETTPFGDLRKIFCDDKGVKLPKLRMAMNAFRGPKDSKKATELDPETLELKEKFGIKLKLQDADPTELLRYYHPDKPNHLVTIALKKRFGDKPIIVFKPDSRVVDIEETANYIVDLEQGFPEQETIEVDGVLVRIYPVGVIPNQMVDEDPLYPGMPLKRDRSVVNRINWSSIGLNTRKFCRIIVGRGDIDVENRMEVRELIKMASNPDLSSLIEFYPEAHLEFRERDAREDLPNLKMSMQDANSKQQNPFCIGGNWPGWKRIGI